jgi:anti-sigma B factor antagonist
MEITHRKSNNIEILELSGRFDAYEVPAVVKWFDDHTETKYAVINLSGVGFIDSSGLATLVKALKRCRQNDGDLYISNMQQAVRIIFELTRLDKAFQIFDNEEDAVQSFSTN